MPVSGLRGLVHGCCASSSAVVRGGKLSCEMVSESTLLDPHASNDSGRQIRAWETVTSGRPRTTALELAQRRVCSHNTVLDGTDSTPRHRRDSVRPCRHHPHIPRNSARPRHHPRPRARTPVQRRTSMSPPSAHLHPTRPHIPHIHATLHHVALSRRITKGGMGLPHAAFIVRSFIIQSLRICRETARTNTIRTYSSLDSVDFAGFGSAAAFFAAAAVRARAVPLVFVAAFAEAFAVTELALADFSDFAALDLAVAAFVLGFAAFAVFVVFAVFAAVFTVPDFVAAAFRGALAAFATSAEPADSLADASSSEASAAALAA